MGARVWTKSTRCGLLKERPRDPGSDLLFISNKGQFNGDTVNQMFAKYCRLASEARGREERADRGFVLAHSCPEHSRITSVVGKMDLYLVKLLAGHAALSSTLRYVHGSQKPRGFRSRLYVLSQRRK